ncbi:MAG: hypothetical protein HRT89_13065, partial [Lentisphaeria bacterium]|nr:hypothetical protein [Lentisphaeria bacterium]
VLKIWNIKTKKIVFEKDLGIVIQSVRFSPSAKRIAVSKWDSTVDVFEIKVPLNDQEKE